MRSIRSHRAGFWIAAYAFAVSMAFSALPTPLYALYQRRDGFSTATITVVFGVYAAGVAVSLFLAGHASDWIGRRRTLLAATVLNVAAAGLFLAWRDLAGLVVARTVSGLAIGLVTATATAYLGELRARSRPQAPGRRAESVATVANLGGIGAGPLLSGSLAQWVRSPLTVPYLVFLVLFALAFAGLLAVPETKEREHRRYRPQHVAVPAGDRGRFAAAAAGGVVAFAAFGLFSALAPTFLATLGETSRALAGAAAFAVFAAAAGVQLLAGRRPLRTMLAAGTGSLVTGLVLASVAVWLPHPSLVLFLSGGAVTGAGAGLLFKAMLTTVVEIAPPDVRAEALAGFFLASYLGLAVPVVGLGVATRYTEPRTALVGFAGLALLAAFAAVRFLSSTAARPAARRA